MLEGAIVARAGARRDQLIILRIQKLLQKVTGAATYLINRKGISTKVQSIPSIPDTPRSNNKNFGSVLISAVHKPGQKLTETSRLDRNSLVKPLQRRPLEISLHSQRACTTSSECSLQSSHLSEGVICLQCKFSIVGKASLQALHTKCLILLGTRSCQRPFQNFF